MALEEGLFVKDYIARLTHQANIGLADLTLEALFSFLGHGLIVRLGRCSMRGEVVTEIARFEAAVTRFEMVVNKREVTDQTLREALRCSTDLPAPVRADIETDLGSGSLTARQAAYTSIDVWKKACRRALSTPPLGLGRGNFLLLPDWELATGGIDTDRYSLLVTRLVQNPKEEGCMCTPVEKEIDLSVKVFKAWVGDTTPQSLCLLPFGMISGLQDPMIAVHLLNLFDTIGVKLESPAAKVTIRQGLFSTRSSPTTWRIYPTEDHAVLVASYPDEPLLDTVYLVRGSYAQVYAWLAEKYGPTDRQDDPLELLDASPELPNNVVDALHARGSVDQARVMQAKVTAFLLAYAEDQRQDH